MVNKRVYTSENLMDKSGATVIMELEHHKIHEGEHFTCQDYDSSVDIISPKKWLYVLNGDNLIHFIFELNVSKPGLIEFFESPTVTDNGTLLGCHNNNRYSSNNSTLECYSDPTTTDGGTRLLVNVVGTDGNTPNGGSGGATKRDNEFLLHKDKTYMIKYTTKINDTRVNCCVEHYEVD